MTSQTDKGQSAISCKSVWQVFGTNAEAKLADALASSGGDTRVLRHGYGDERLYLDLAARARELFVEHERLWNVRLLEPTGLLWLVQDDDGYEQASLPHLAAAGGRDDAGSSEAQVAGRLGNGLTGIPGLLDPAAQAVQRRGGVVRRVRVYR